MSTPKPSKEAALELGRRIRAARKARGMTQTEVERAVGVTHGPLSGWEAGTRNPTLGSLLALCRVLRVSPCTLLGGLHRL